MAGAAAHPQRPVASSTGPLQPIVMRPYRWGNPFVIRPDLAPGSKINDRYIAVPTDKEAVRRFRDDYMTPARREEARRDLRGKDLACYCNLDAPCHADVLIEIANS
jgi:hypothetical protein